MNPTEQFRNAMTGRNIIPPMEILADGALHRCDAEGTGGKGDAAYVLHLDGVPAGGYENHRDGHGWENWRADIGRKLTPAEEAEHHAKAEAMRRQREAEKSQRQADAAKKALAIWDDADDAPADHPYLKRKGIQPHNVRAHENNLLVPMRDATGKLWNVERIAPEKPANGTDKKGLYGGRRNGLYHAIGSADELKKHGLLCVAEGFADAASIREATGYPVINAFNVANLGPVGLALHEKYPETMLIFCADDDYRTEGNPGLTKATEAARSVGGLVVVPDFGANRPDGAKDFNDLAKLRGAGAVRDTIEAALKVGANDTAKDKEPPPAADPDGWPEPSSLPKLPPVPDFPIDLLPDVLQALVSDCAARARYRPDFAAVAAMVALGSVIGRKLGIRLKKFDDWTEYANVWGGIIGPPSALKSPANRDGVKPFKALQVAADAVYQIAADTYALELEAFNLRKEAKKKKAVEKLKQDATAKIDLGSDAAPEAPIQRTYWTSDATAAKLGELLAANSTGLLVERDELNSLLQSLEDEANADARGLYLSGWSGKEGYRFDRISRGTVTLPKYALSVFGGIQPGPLARYVRGAFSGERADGLLQRFQLLVWPEPESFEYVDRWPDSKAREAAAALFERADTFDPQAIGAHDKYGNEPPFVRLSDDAQIVFVDWYTRFMQFARSADSAGGVSAPLAAHFGKYPGLVGKLALILHVADEPTSKEVSARTLYKALAWIEYLTPHAERVYHAVEHPEAGAAELLLSRLKRDELPEKFKAWEITRKGWHGLSDREAVKKACRLLFEYGWLIELDPGGGQGIGRPADPTYAVSPRVGLSA
jgi:putative DNA primase/helicase